jgi:hypothetical protein
MLMGSLGFPNGNCGPLVDKVIGDAFQTVKTVADNIDDVKYAAYNMPALSLIAKQYEAMGASVLENMTVVTPQMFGAYGDGVHDDTLAFTRAFNSGARAIFCPPGTYMVKNVLINTHCIIYGNSAVFTPATGANSVFTLTGFRPSLVDCYIDCSNGNLTLNLNQKAAVVVVSAQFPTVRNVGFENCISCLIIGDGVNEVRDGTFRDLMMEAFTSSGVFVRQNVNTCTFDNMRIYSGVIPSPSQPGKSLPMPGCIGFQIISTGSTLACGGHLLTNIDCEGMLIGFQFTDAQLTTLQNCIGDGVGRAAFQLSGTCNRMKFDNCFAGSCLMGYEVVNSGVNIWITNPTFALIGVQLTWGATNFYDAGSAFCISVSGTASVTHGGSFMTSPESPASFFVASTAALSFENDTPEHLDSTTQTDGTGATLFLVYGGSSAAEFPSLVAHKPGIVTAIITQNNVDPGVGKKFTYRVRKNSADTGVGSVLTGASPGVFQSVSQAFVTVARGDNIDVAVIPDAGAAASYHRVTLMVRYFG